MSDIARVEITEDAKKELAQIPTKGLARVFGTIERVQLLGWQASLQKKLVKHLENEIYEIRQKGKGAAYRVLCFITGDAPERIVVTTSFEAKSMLIGQRRMAAAIERAENRRDKWFKQQEDGDD